MNGWWEGGVVAWCGSRPDCAGAWGVQGTHLCPTRAYTTNRGLLLRKHHRSLMRSILVVVTDTGPAMPVVIVGESAAWLAASRRRVANNAVWLMGGFGAGDGTSMGLKVNINHK